MFDFVFRNEIERIKYASRKDSILFIDTNLGFDHAYRLAKDGQTVYYFINWQSAFPKLEDSITGDGFKELKKIEDIGEVLDNVKYVMFVDIGFGSLADMLRKQGYYVFGTSSKAEKLESDRVFMIRQLKKLGIKVPESIVIKGKQNVVKYMSKHEGELHFIKLNKFRGNIETFSVSSSLEAEIMLDQAGFGPYNDKVEFVVQKAVEDGVEIGLDVFFNGKYFIRPYFYTIEVKGAGTVGKYTEKSIWDEIFLDKIRPFLKQSNYHGNISIEGFWDGKDFYAIDPCMRLPFPNSGIFPHFIKNYTDVIKAVARGDDIKIEVDYPYYTQIGVYSDITDIWRRIQFDRKYRNKVGFRRIVKQNGYWVPPGDGLMATALGCGNTYEESIKDALEVADNIDGYSLYYIAHIDEDFNKKIMKLNQLNGGF